MKISFHGAAGTVTGSCYLLEREGQKTLIDCGLFQGPPDLESQNHEPFSFDASEIDCVLLTHAHLDHCGRLPILIKNNFKGPVYMTAATKELLEITLEDAAHIMKEKDEADVLYTSDHVLQLIEQARIINCDKPFTIPGFSVLYVNAGHILGSASIVLTEEKTGKKIVFSGDLGNSPQDLIMPTEYVLDGDVVIMESTYGDSLHPKESASDAIQSEINAVEENNGTLLIPSFSLERTQEILHTIEHLKRSEKVKSETPVFLDSPMAIEATNVFRKFENLYNKELKADEQLGDPFSFAGLKVINHAKASYGIKDIPGTKVIIAGSGMMTGGRIVNHAKTFLPNPTTHLLFVGFQAENTLGREILEGAKIVNIQGEKVSINGKINVTHAMSSHADQKGLLTWFSKIKGVKTLFLTHGEEEPRKILGEKIKENNTIEVNYPEKEDFFEI